MEKKLNAKKIALIVGIVVDVALTLFLLVISIIMLVETATKTQPEIMEDDGFIAFLQKNPTIYGLVFVVPLFILLAVNIVGLVLYVKRTTKAETPKLGDLDEEQKALLKQQLLKELQGAEEKKPEEPKEEVKEE